MRTSQIRPKMRSRVWAFGLGVALLMTQAGCPGFGPGTGLPVGGGDGGGEQPEVLGILNILNNAPFSDDVVLTVFYSVPADAQTVVAFFRLLNAPANAGGQPIGVEEVIAADLPAGANQSFAFDTADLRPGFYQLAIRADDQTFFSVGTIEIQGPPNPLFLEPADDMEVRAGVEVMVVADVGDPEGRANWRLFVQPSSDPQVEEGQEASGQLLGTRLAEDLGNAVEFEWDTSNVAPGSYRFGLSATDTGFTIADAVAAGRADAIITTYSDAVVTILPATGEARPPLLTITTDEATAFVGDVVPIEFSATTFEGTTFEVTLYYVLEGQDDKTVFATITDPAVSSADFATAGLASGVYEIGGTIFDGLNPEFEVPDDGRALVSLVGPADVALAVSLPAADRQVAQGETVNIEWSTNVPDGTGRTIRVFARACTACDADDLGTGADIPIATGLSLNVTTASWDTSTATGRHVILVEMTIPELSAPVLARAPGVVRVSTVAPQFWMGSVGGGAAVARQGERFQGVNFQDNAGTFLASVGDYNADGREEFIIGARYGKPFFQNPSGIGIGEGYMIFGGERRNATINLNEVGTASVPGVIFTGIRPLDTAQESTDGLSSIRQIPDQDGDSLPELMFGFPFVDSSDLANRPLLKARQFLRGGTVVVSSQNTVLQSSGGVMFLDQVGQVFTRTVLGLTIADAPGSACTAERSPFFFSDENTDDDNCTVESISECSETFDGPFWGFTRDLADSYTAILRPFSQPAVCTGPTLCSAGLASVTNLFGCSSRGGIANPPTSLEDVSNPIVGSTFYPVRFCSSVDGATDNVPMEPMGARIIGRDPGMTGDEANTGDKFGSSIAVSGPFILASAPNRQPADNEVTGVAGPDVPTDPGIVYLFRMNNLWPDWRTTVPMDDDGTIVGQEIGPREFVLPGMAPPMPFQYQIDTVSACGAATLLPDPFLVMGEEGQRIDTVESVTDFNLDGREDFAIGAPGAGGNDGAVYVAFRRNPAIEGDYILSRLSRDPSDVERLAGLRINGRPGSGERFGEVIARSLTIADVSGNVISDGADFNGDGVDDLILGNPRANGSQGEVIIVFGTRDLVTPVGGMDLNTLLAATDVDGNPRAIRIAGAQAGDQFGFNVAIAGDFDGDGLNDLVVAAPNASPMFDSDEDGIPDAPGIDVLNLVDPTAPFGDGIQDDVNGDGVVTPDDNLQAAGLVYLILGSNDLVSLADSNNAIDVSTLGLSTFRGVVFVGRAAGDQLGGGNESKRMKRSFGIGAAGDVDADGRDDLLIGSILADPDGRTDSGEAYLIYGFSP